MLDYKLYIALMFFIMILVKPLFSVLFERDVNFINRKFIFTQIERQLHIYHRALIYKLEEIEYTFFLIDPHRY